MEMEIKMKKEPTNNCFLDDWINQDETVQVALLSPPVTYPPVPSIALSIFKSALKDAGIFSKVIYGSFPAIHLLGTDTISKLSCYLPFRRNSEYLFARLTDVDSSISLSEFLKPFSSACLSDRQKESLKELMEDALKKADQIVEAIALRIIKKKARILDVSSIYAQQCPALAIIKRVKELDPSVVTIMGGHNVSGQMGMAILRNFPSVDYISFGEGDEAVIQFCASQLRSDQEPLPYGIVGRKEIPDTIPYRMTKDLDLIPTPDYDDFFTESRREASGYYGEIPKYYEQTFENTVFLEGSRGCWWGAKHPCAFCGLNGLTNVYREKSPQRLYQEIREMTERYPGVNLQLSDNVLSSRMIRELPALLAGGSESPASYSLLAEIKANLRPEDIKALARAGFHTTQPGIESLNDNLLKQMGKGCTAVQNIALMKYCRSVQMYPVWNLLTHIPGERREDYEQMMELIPLILHLNPPTFASNIDYVRFSRYCDHPEEYGFEFRPDPLYYSCFGNRADIVDNIGIYYQLTGGPFIDTIRQNQDLYNQIDQAVKDWRNQFYSNHPPQLMMRDLIFGISIFDSRPCAVKENLFLLGLSAKIYKLAWEPISWDTLTKHLPGFKEEDLRIALDDLISKKIMLFLSGKYLALATRDFREQE